MLRIPSPFPTINWLPLSGKCRWNCLSCCLPEANAPHTLQKIIELSPTNTLNCFTHLTRDLTPLTSMIPLIKKNKQRWGAVHMDWQHDALVHERPDILFFPFYSLDRQQHNQLTGSESFDTLLSNLNHTPKPIKRRVLFFANKDNFSELADLDGFAYALGIHVWVVPYNLFTPDDYSHEEMLYLKRLNTSPRVFVHPAHLVGTGHKITQDGICHLLKAEASFIPWSAWWNTFWDLKRIL